MGLLHCDNSPVPMYSFSNNNDEISLETLYSISKDLNIHHEVGSSYNEDFIHATDINPYSVHLKYKVHLTAPPCPEQDDEINNYLEVLDKAYETGAKVCVMHVDYIEEGKLNFKEKIDNFINAVEPVMTKAKEYEINIAIENQLDLLGIFGSTPKQIQYILSRLRENYDNVGICLDIGHANIASESNQCGYNGTLENWLDIFEEDIIHTHIHENHGNSVRYPSGLPKDEHLPVTGLFPDSFYKKLMSLPNLKMLNFEFKLPENEIKEEIIKSIEYLEQFRE